MKIVWTPEAEFDRVEIWDAIAADSPRAALRMDALFSDSFATLASHPRIGREGQISGTRELTPHASYRVIYEIEGETVWILALVHAARLWPPVRD